MYKIYLHTRNYNYVGSLVVSKNDLIPCIENLIINYNVDIKYIG